MPNSPYFDPYDPEIQALLEMARVNSATGGYDPKYEKFRRVGITKDIAAFASAGGMADAPPQARVQSAVENAPDQGYEGFGKYLDAIGLGPSDKSGEPIDYEKMAAKYLIGQSGVKPEVKPGVGRAMNGDVPDHALTIPLAPVGKGGGGLSEDPSSPFYGSGPTQHEMLVVPTLQRRYLDQMLTAESLDKGLFESPAQFRARRAGAWDQGKEIGNAYVAAAAMQGSGRGGPVPVGNPHYYDNGQVGQLYSDGTMRIATGEGFKPKKDYDSQWGTNKEGNPVYRAVEKGGTDVRESRALEPRYVEEPGPPNPATGQYPGRVILAPAEAYLAPHIGEEVTVAPGPGTTGQKDIVSRDPRTLKELGREKAGKVAPQAPRESGEVKAADKEIAALERQKAKLESEIASTSAKAKNEAMMARIKAGLTRDQLKDNPSDLADFDAVANAPAILAAKRSTLDKVNARLAEIGGRTIPEDKPSTVIDGGTIGDVSGQSAGGTVTRIRNGQVVK